MYNLMKSYSVPTIPEDLAVYSTLQPSMSSMNNAIDKAEGERDANLAKFCQHLQQDIKELNNEVKRIKQQAEVRQLIHTPSFVLYRIHSGDYVVSLFLFINFFLSFPGQADSGY